MFLDYNKVKKFLIDNVTSVKTVDEYINDLNTLNFMDIILDNISFEVVVLLNTITYEVYFNSKSIGFVERDNKLDVTSKPSKLLILKELLNGNKECMKKLNNLIMNYNVSKLDENKVDKLSVSLKLCDILSRKQKFSDTSYRNYCNILYNIYYDKVFIASYTEGSYYYSNNPSNNFNDCFMEVNKTVSVRTISDVNRIVKKIKLENYRLWDQLNTKEDEIIKVKKK